MEIDTRCPYCGEPVTIEIDVTGGRAQKYDEDCPVCCRPWDVSLHIDERGEASAELMRQDA